MTAALQVVSSTLTPGQSAAYHGIRRLILGRQAIGAVLSAPAGSGKTYLVAALVEDLLRRRLRVVVSAPTNKAVGVISERVPDAEAMTVHALLGLRLTKQEHGSYRLEREGDPKTSRFDVVVVDEASMVDASLFDLLLECRGSAFLLLVGDPHQLPPPISGLDRSPVFDHPGLEHFSLDEVVRQKADSPILALATQIRQFQGGRFPIADLVGHPGIQKVSRDAVASIWTPGARVLAWRNETVEAYNRSVHTRFHPHAVEPFCPGERVILAKQHETPAGLRLNNSAEGVLLGIEEGRHPVWSGIPAWRLRLEMDSGDRADAFYPQDPGQYRALVGDAWTQWREAKAEKDYAMARALSARAWSLSDAFIPLRLGYASTVHKAQGSTFRVAIVDVQDLDDMRSHSEFNKLMYTAVTRPSHGLILAV